LYGSYASRILLREIELCFFASQELRGVARTAIRSGVRVKYHRSNGKQLNLRRADLWDWRDGFAEKLREVSRLPMHYLDRSYSVFARIPMRQ
jgi:hypothetical protein